MRALATAHDASVQMIDTTIVRVHQHAACITRNQRQSMGRSRGGLTSKLHAVVDNKGLPVRLALTGGEAHDNRLADKLLTCLDAIFSMKLPLVHYAAQLNAPTVPWPPLSQVRISGADMREPSPRAISAFSISISPRTGALSSVVVRPD